MYKQAMLHSRGCPSYRLVQEWQCLEFVPHSLQAGIPQVEAGRDFMAEGSLSMPAVSSGSQPLWLDFLASASSWMLSWVWSGLVTAFLRKRKREARTGPGSTGCSLECKLIAENANDPSHLILLTDALGAMTGCSLPVTTAALIIV